MDIYLKQAIMHIIDRKSGDPVFSQVELDLSTEYIRDYLIKKIQKLTSSQTKTGTLAEDSEIAQLSQQAEENFINFSQSFVTRWYESYQQSEDAPDSDVFVVLYELDTTMYVAFLKVKYTEGYTHYVDTNEHGIHNDLIINRAILAGKAQKADEGITINLTDLTYELIEKKYTFSGEKMNYFSNKVIESQPAPSLEDNVKVIKKTAEEIGEKFNTPSYDLVADVKEAVYDTIEEHGQIDTKQVAEQVFKDNVTARMSFEEEVEEQGLSSQTPMMREVREVSEKKYGKQKLKLSNGIELVVPLDVYRDPELIEFINSPDGTISVTIKNVEEIINRM
ncbi:nucleoid-associated protein [Tetragenococcus halophilus]|uniref:nucleoid-associated protein n=1 Tax=Tetragenococcus halophilus TaxID=51669 RepID=UPI001F2D7E65|nr:nucleoid-associated protein [Tetragenococcus halophilus]MCF1684962.1 nucleoid-associated protein [Tetragenococcus halophilus]